MSEGVVVIGGGPAGLATVRAYRESGGSGTVTLISAESRLPYNRPPLTKEFLRGELDAAELPIEPHAWFQQNRVELRLGQRALALDAQTGTVTLKDAQLQADAVVLATGAEPSRPPIPGLDDARVRVVREQQHSEQLIADVGGNTPVTVLGTGFIGCEIAASLAMRGAAVTLVGLEPAPQQQRLGEQAAARIAAWMGDLDVYLKAGQEVTAVHEGRTVALADGTVVESALVIAAMGVKPRSELAAAAAGLAVQEGRIATDKHMHAGGRVYAVGDVALALNRAAGRRLAVEHWGDALAHGTVAGQVLAGEDDAAWETVPGFWSTIGTHTLKYAAWGDGYDSSEFEAHEDGAFTVWYRREGVPVGVLTHDRDEDYEAGSDLILKQGTPAR